MKTPFKKIIFALSAALNALTFLLFALASLSPRPLQFSLGSFSRRYAHSALIASVPWDGDASVVYGPIEITLKKGSLASLQLSAIRDGPSSNKKEKPVQANMAIEPLYDPSVIKIEPSGFGIYIYALESGETALQIFSGGSFRDLAVVRVYE